MMMTQIENKRNTGQRVCPCHHLPVVQRVRVDASGVPRLSDYCPLDDFSLGYGGGCDPEDMLRRRRELALRRICAGCGRALDNDRKCNWCGREVA